MPDVLIHSEKAMYASAQLGGHPYYIYCLVMSKYENKQFDKTDTIDRLIQYEIEQGKIFGFWNLGGWCQ